jgi:hypothetical protein
MNKMNLIKGINLDTARTANRRLAKKRVQCLNEALCFEIRFFAKLQTVMGKANGHPAKYKINLTDK